MDNENLTKEQKILINELNSSSNELSNMIEQYPYLFDLSIINQKSKEKIENFVQLPIKEFIANFDLIILETIIDNNLSVGQVNTIYNLIIISFLKHLSDNYQKLIKRDLELKSKFFELKFANYLPSLKDIPSIINDYNNSFNDINNSIERLDKENDNVYEEIAKIKVSKKFHDLGLNSKVMILNKIGVIEDLRKKNNNGNNIKYLIAQIIAEDNQDSVKAEIAIAIKKNDSKQEYLNEEAEEFLKNNKIIF